MNQDNIPLSTQIRDSTLSGLGSGAVLGGLGGLLGGVRSKRDLLKTAALGGLGYGAISGGATAAGGAMMGPITPEEKSPYAYRGSLGGVLGGGALGAGLGALAATGKLRGLLGSKAGKAAVDGMGLKPNVITDKFAAWSKTPNARARALRGAGLGALTLGGVGGFLGNDEGMQLDFIRNAKADAIAAARRREMIG